MPSSSKPTSKNSLGLDLGSNSIGWAFIDQATGQPFSLGKCFLPSGMAAEAAANRRRKRAMRRAARRKAQQARRLPAIPIGQWVLQQIERKQTTLLHGLLGLLFAAFLLMAGIQHTNFQFWFNLAITVLLTWIAIKNSNGTPPKNN